MPKVGRVELLQRYEPTTSIDTVTLIARGWHAALVVVELRQLFLTSIASPLEKDPQTSGSQGV